MVSLLDLAPAVKTVPVRGFDIEIHGVSAEGVVALFKRFPELTAMIAKRSFDAQTIIGMGGELVGAIIAAGCGHPGDPDHEEVARRLPVSEQADLLEPILKATLPNGLAPFVKRLEALGVLVAADRSATARATKSPKPSSS